MNRTLHITSRAGQNRADYCKEPQQEIYDDILQGINSHTKVIFAFENSLCWPKFRAGPRSVPQRKWNKASARLLGEFPRKWGKDIGTSPARWRSSVSPKILRAPTAAWTERVRESCGSTSQGRFKFYRDKTAYNSDNFYKPSSSEGELPALQFLFHQLLLGVGDRQDGVQVSLRLSVRDDPLGHLKLSPLNGANCTLTVP